MYIHICGNPKLQKPAAEELRAYYSYRGQACFIYDFLRPVETAHDAVLISLQHYELFPAGVNRVDLAQVLGEWLQPVLPELARRELNPVTAKWEELKMFFIAVVYHMPSDVVTDVPIKEPAFKVRLLNAGEDVKANYDLCLSADITDPKKIAEAVGAALHDHLFSVHKSAPSEDKSSPSV